MVNNLEYYKVFYHVAKCRSLTQAAGILAVSQPAVSQAMKQLEEALSVKLFVRASKGIDLTPEGKVLFSYVQRGYEQLEEGERQLAGMLDLECGELRIGASDMTLRFYLLPFLERYHEQYPHIKVNVTNAPTPATLQLLKEHKIDFGVISTPFAAEKTVVLPVKEIEDCFVAGKKFMQYKHKKLNFKQLEQMPIISLEKNTSTRKYIDTFLAKSNVVMQPEFELATSDMIVQFALRNLGIGCVMKEFAREYLEKEELFMLQFKEHIPTRQICVVTEENTPISKAAQRIISMLQYSPI